MIHMIRLYKNPRKYNNYFTRRWAFSTKYYYVRHSSCNPYFHNLLYPHFKCVHNSYDICTPYVCVQILEHYQTG